MPGTSRLSLAEVTVVLAAVIIPLGGIFAWPLAVLGAATVMAALLIASVQAPPRCACHARPARK